MTAMDLIALCLVSALLYRTLVPKEKREEWAISKNLVGYWYLFLILVFVCYVLVSLWEKVF